MTWAFAKNHPIETLAEWLAPILLGGAAGWSAWTIATPAHAAAAAVLGTLSGVIVMRRFGVDPAERRAVRIDLAPLDSIIADEGELLLDDPLHGIEEDSRVIQLFSPVQPTPGELVERISDFLGEGRRTTQAGGAHSLSSADARDALQSALANIRASLR